MAKPWEKYANPAVGYGADPYKVAEEQRKIADQEMQREAAARAAAAAEAGNRNTQTANDLAAKKFAADLAKDGLMIGPDGAVVKNPNGPVGKAVPNDPQRRAQIESLLDVIKRTRAQADDFWAVGEQGKRAREWPLVGPSLGQNRADVEGLTKSIEGDLIQQQIARLSAVNGGNGVASIANSETEAARMAAAIANLSPDQSLPEFNAGLDRAEQYYRRQLSGLPGGAQNQNIMPSVNEGNRYANDGTSTKTGNNGFDKYVTDQDRERADKLQQAYIGGADAATLNRMATDMGIQPFDDEKLSGMLSARAQGRPVRLSPFATGERSLAQQNIGALADSNVGAYGISTANSLTLGGLDEIVGATQGQRAGDLAQYGKEYARNESPVPSFFGDVSGGVMLGSPLTSGLRYGGIKGAQAASPFVAKMAERFAGSVPRAVISAATMQGALTGAGEMNENRLLGATIGGGAGAAGGYLGGKIFGAGADAATSGPATRGGNKVRGLFGRRQRPEVPTIDQPSQMVNNSIGGNFDNVISQMDEAAGFGLPMMLADADPALQSLAGASARRSPQAMEMAENAIIPRQRGQYDRLLGAIDRDLGPTQNIPQYSDDLIKKARTDSRPFYDAYEAAPGASSVDVSGIIKTPMGQAGLDNAIKRVQNRLGPDGQPVDPQSLGFDFNDAGEMVLGQTPSFKTLDLMKKGLDDVINEGYDPILRQYTPDAQSAQGLKKNLVGQIDGVNPFYAKARAAYEGPAGERHAFQKGVEARSITPDQETFNLQNMAAPKQQQYRAGRISDMVDQAGRVRYASNPWETIIGAPQQTQRISNLFPEGADRFGRQYELEGQMARTNNDIIGNSKTAGRLQADADFAPGMLQTAALDAATGSPGIMSAARLGAKFAGGELGRIGAKKKADALAPILFDADPVKNAAIMRELQKTIKVQKRTKGLIGSKPRRLGSVAGGSSGVGFTFGLTD